MPKGERAYTLVAGLVEIAAVLIAAVLVLT
jgi:hypothetical protein